MNECDRAMLELSSLNGFTAEKKFGKPGRTIVTMGQGNLVESSDDQQEVFTFGASGCNVVAVEGKRKGKRFGAVTHYDPLSINGNVAKIEELGRRAGQGGRGNETNAEVFVRGDWENVDGKWVMKPKDVQETGRLVGAIKGAFGKKTNVTVTPYSESRKSGMEHQGEVSVDISGSSKRKKRILGIF
jgi:hypothetical protein